jgi:hypothetical protein
VRSTRFPILVVLLLVVAAATWYYVSQHAGRGGETIAIHFTKLDGKTLGEVRVSLRPRQSGESAAEHLHNTVLYAAVQAVAGPPNDVQAIRFPPGTRVIGVSVDGSSRRLVRRKRRIQRARLHRHGHSRHRCRANNGRWKPAGNASGGTS